MNEDLEALMKVMDQLEDLSSASAAINSETPNENSMFFVELGKKISNLEHEVEKLKGENAFLRTLLKQQFGYNT